MQTWWAWQQRLSFARTSVLFSALAVEAGANFYMAVALADTDLKALEKLPPPDKLLVAPRLAGHGQLFEADREPMGLVVRLFKLRNRLMHPKVGTVTVGGARLTGKEGYEDFNPKTAADFVVAVEQVLGALAKAGAPESLHGATCVTVADHAESIRKAARGWTEALPVEQKTLAELLVESGLEPPAAETPEIAQESAG